MGSVFPIFCQAENCFLFVLISRFLFYFCEPILANFVFASLFLAILLFYLFLLVVFFKLNFFAFFGLVLFCWLSFCLVF